MSFSSGLERGYIAFVGCILVSVDECFGSEVVHGGRHSLEVGLVDMLSDPDPHVYISISKSWRGFLFSICLRSLKREVQRICVERNGYGDRFIFCFFS